MFLHFTIHSIRCIEQEDNPFDPFDWASEVYQTWHMSALSQVDQDDAPIQWARQGFSMGGWPNDGRSFKHGQEQIVLDPQITFSLPESAFERDAVTLYRLDVHHWEADNRTATQKVRAVFSDETLRYLVHAWQANRESADAAAKAVKDWIDGNWKELLTGVAAAAGVAASPWVAVGFRAAPLLGLLVNWLAHQGDEYWQMDRFAVQMHGTGASLRWRITGPKGPGQWHDGAGVETVELELKDKTAKNRMLVTYKFRFID